MLMILLFQRLGIIMILAFLLVNNSYFRQLIEERSKREKLVLIIIFGIFVIISNMTGIEITSDKSLVERPILTTISHSDSLANTRTLVITTASLVGGPLVGTVVGFIGGVHRFFQGNFSGAFYIVSSALVGYISGRLGDQLKTNNLYPSTSQVIVISIIAESIQMLFVGFFTGWDLVKLIFIPMMLLNSLGSTLFLAILKTYLSNERQLRAVQTRDVLDLTQQTLPYLRQGLSQQSATKVCNIIKQHTNFDAVGLTDRTNVLAHIGVGQDHHIAGQAVKTDLSKSVILNGQPQIALDKTAIACPDQSCLLNSAIVVPLKINNETVGALKMYFSGDKKMTEVEENLALGLAQIFSGQLAIGIAEEQNKLANIAEIKALQSQINPHFFFNAINTISALIRLDANKARYALMQLSTFFRTSLQGGQDREISLEQEKAHVDAYMNLEKLRFPDKYQLDYHITVSTKMTLPPFGLQVLVENAVRHAFKERKKDNHICISITDQGEFYKVAVSDNGQGISPNMIDKLGQETVSESKGTGTALVNLNNRLNLLYSSASQLHFDSTDQGTTVWYEIPYQKGDKDEHFNS
ncbi:two-component system sensor histidine kinase LytS [Streptococcus mutans]|uniref:two-component system sensor histidine kinase LytS n=1 Tax=Streptococcus mutans TaxID=1309 RepID=UPI0002BDDDE4|nr:two-component system sensor histidine kinase LytS [Streptococcus mutans]EMP61460.1 putative histidine kinase LytS [Streptococcus mutans 5DC8]